MTKRVRIAHFFSFMNISLSPSIGGAHFSLLLLFGSPPLFHLFYELQLITFSPVDEQFSDEKQFLIVQIQNL